MSPRKNVARIAALGLVAAAAAAPAASAMPIDQSYPSYPTPTPAQASGGAIAVPDIGGDLRGEAAANGSVAKPAISGDLRGEAAAGGSRPAVRPLPGPPTWPEHPAPIVPRVAPAAAPGGTDDGAPAVVIALLGALALGGVVVFTTTRYRAPSPAAH
jgi:hypothetical protein